MATIPPLLKEAAPGSAAPWKARASEPARLRFIECFTWVFESPQWFLNLLLVAVLANFLPIVGQIVGMGYFFECTEDQLRSPRFGYLDLDLNRFVEYLKRGWKPWLVQLITSLIGVAFALFCYFPMLLFAISFLNTRDEMWMMVGGVLIGLTYVIYIALLTLVTVAPIPLIFRVGLTGDLRDGLRIRWALSFTRKLLPELFLMTFMISILLLPLVILGTLACLVGTYFVAGWLSFVIFRVVFQLYEIFLARGGEAIPLPAEVKMGSPFGPAGAVG